MSSVRIRPVHVVIVVTALAVTVLSGCAAAPAGHSGGPHNAAVNPHPAAAKPAVAVTTPDRQPLRYDTDCASLLPEDVVAAAFGEKGVVLTGIERESGALFPYTTRHIGGLECSWSNTETKLNAEGALNPAYGSVSIVAIPDPENEFSRLYRPDVDEVRFGEDSVASCIGITGACYIDVRISGSWLQIRVFGLNVASGATDADTVTKATPLVRTVLEGIPDPEMAAWGRGSVDCEGALPFDDMLREFGVPEGVAWEGTGGGGPDEQSDASAEYAGALLCLQGYIAGDEPSATVKVMPGGAWVFQPGEAGGTVANGTEVVRVPGTSASESYLDCEIGTKSGQCNVAMAVGQDLVEVGLFLGGNPYTGPTEQERASLLSLAAHVVENMT